MGSKLREQLYSDADDKQQIQTTILTSAPKNKQKQRQQSVRAALIIWGSHANEENLKFSSVSPLGRCPKADKALIPSGAQSNWSHETSGEID